MRLLRFTRNDKPTFFRLYEIVNRGIKKIENLTH